MPAGPNTHSFDAMLSDWFDRLGAVERRLTRGVGLPGRLSTVGQYVVDWNDVTAPGAYWADGNSLNNPPGVGTWYMGGPLYHDGGGRVIQIVHEAGATDDLFAVSYMRYWGGSSWTPWLRIDVRALLDGQRLGAIAPTLGTADLDTVIESGNYVQTANANATLARNYPETQAGYLEVIRAGGFSGNSVGVLQRYTIYPTAGQRIWQRTWYGSWGNWIQVDHWDNINGKPSTFPPSAHTHAAADVTSGTFAAARLPAAGESAIGGVERLTQAEVNTGTDTTRYASIATIRAATWLPRRTQTGSVNGTASAYSTVTLSGFSAAPKVVAAGGRQSAVGIPRIVNVTSSSFQVGVWSVGGAQIAFSDVDWIAVEI